METRLAQLSFALEVVAVVARRGSHSSSKMCQLHNVKIKQTIKPKELYHLQMHYLNVTPIGDARSHT